MKLREPNTQGTPPEESTLTLQQKECASYGHEWVPVGSAPDGTTFSRCRICGLEVEG
jgi:hypothetical protein